MEMRNPRVYEFNVGQTRLRLKKRKSSYIIQITLTHCSACWNEMASPSDWGVKAQTTQNNELPIHSMVHAHLPVAIHELESECAGSANKSLCANKPTSAGVLVPKRTFFRSSGCYGRVVLGPSELEFDGTRQFERPKTCIT